MADQYAQRLEIMTWTSMETISYILYTLKVSLLLLLYCRSYIRGTSGANMADQYGQRLEIMTWTSMETISYILYTLKVSLLLLLYCRSKIQGTSGAPPPLLVQKVEKKPGLDRVTNSSRMMFCTLCFLCRDSGSPKRILPHSIH